MNKIKEFLKGFKKINYIVPLAEKANVSVLRPEFVSHPLFPKIVNSLSALNIKDATFGMRDFKAVKVNDPNLLLEIHGMQKNIYAMKIVTSIFRDTYKREFDATVLMYVAGIDDQLWAFTFTPYVIYTSIIDDYESQLLNTCCDIINAFMNVLKLDKMCQYPLIPINNSKFTNIKMRHYDGVIKTFCQCEEEPYFGLDFLFPDRTDEPPILVNAILSKDIEKTMDENLVVDVVRRNNEYDVIMRDNLNFQEGLVLPVIRKTDDATSSVSEEAAVTIEGDNNETGH